MLRLTSRITVGDYTFNSCVEVEIDSSWEDMTDRCTITIPRKVKWQDKDLAAGSTPALAIGDNVKVELGYDFNYSTYFEGFIVGIGAKTPVTIECQDAFWFLKQCSGTFTYGKGTVLSTVINKIEDIYLDSAIYATHRATINFSPLANTQIGSIRADNVSMAFVLKSLQKYGIVSYMRNNTLYSGLAYNVDQRNEVARQFDWNITEDSMVQKRAEDAKIKITVKSIDNKLLAPVVVGDADGDSVNLLVSGITTQAQMRSLGEAELPRYKYDGWNGSFTTFGDVFIKHGDVISLTDKIIKDRNGKFYVKKVKTNFGTSGFRNTIELHKTL